MKWEEIEKFLKKFDGRYLNHISSSIYRMEIDLEK